MGPGLCGGEVLMYTRGVPQQAYGALSPTPVNIPGAMVTRPAGGINSNYNIVTVMPIARPNSSPSGIAAPFYVTGYDRPNGVLARGGALPVSPTKPRVETDLTDPTTWQREYRFT